MKKKKKHKTQKIIFPKCQRNITTLDNQDPIFSNI